MYQIKRTDKEIDSVMNWMAEGQDSGGHYSGVVPEEMVDQFFRWLIGETDERPDAQ